MTSRSWSAVSMLPRMLDRQRASRQGDDQMRALSGWRGRNCRLGGLQSDIRAGADAHQAEQRIAELRHRQLSVHLHYEHRAEHDGPGSHLESMKIHTVAITDEITYEALRFVPQLL